MATIEHKLIAIGDVHVPHQWAYADATARLAASGFTSDDLGKLALQTDVGTYWRLTATTPTWAQVTYVVGTSAGTVAAGNDSRITGAYSAGGTDVAVADGGTGASSASAARTNLGLVIGTDVQAHDADLDTIAGLTATTDNVLIAVASAWASRTPAQARTTLGLVVGTDVEAHDADLTTIAGLTATTDNFLQAKSSAWASRTPTQVTADLIAVVGDSGSGGTKGLAPAPAAGDAAAAKFLKADGTWAVPSGSGMSNPMTTQDDLIVGGASGTPARLAKGTDGQVLTVDPTTHHLVWATPGAGSGDVVGPSSAVASEIALFDGTTGKLIKRATGSGIAKVTSGVLSAVTAPSGAIVGDTDTQTLTNKTLTIADANLTIQDDGDATKQAKFQASGITAGQTRTLTIPDASTTLVGTDATQTLTNKTLTTPTIGSFANATHDHTNAAGGGALVSASIPNNAADTTGKSAKTDALNSASTVVNVAAATAPSSGQVLTATDSTHATWQTPAAGFSDPTTTKGDLIVHGASTTRIAVGSDGQHLLADSSQTAGVKWTDALDVADFVEDFFGGSAISPNIGAYQVTGTGGTSAGQAAEAGHPGIMQRNTSASSGTSAITNVGTVAGFLPADTFDLTWVVRLNTNDGNTLVRVGAGDSAAAQPSNGVYFEKLAADTDWFIVTRSGGSQTRADSTFAVGTGWVKFRLRRVDASTIGFTIDAHTEANATGTIPTAALLPLTVITNSAAAAKTLDHDLMRLRISGLAR